MTKNQLFKALNQLCNEMHISYNINCGGCCYVAAVLAENLENINIPFKVIHYDLYSCHYAIKVSDRYLNRSDYRKKEITDIYDWKSKDIYSIYYNNSWNEMYNKKWNLIISTRIKALFKKYENSRT